jgi:hypothetical protein
MTDPLDSEMCFVVGGMIYQIEREIYISASGKQIP